LSNKEGESPAFRELFPSVVTAFPRLFQVVTADAAFTNTANAEVIVEHRKDYLFSVKGNQPTLFEEIQRGFSLDPVFYGEQEHLNGTAISRYIRRRAMPESIEFPGAKQIIQLRQRRHHESNDTYTCEDWYYITSIPVERYSDSELLKLIRLHWGIENGPNWTCDVMFNEDTHFPCRQGQGPDLLSWLQVLAYNVVAMVRSLCLIKPKTARGKKTTLIPFATLMEYFFLCLVHEYFANPVLDNI
jgi:predicted transposase YbfD/YdcC